MSDWEDWEDESKDIQLPSASSNLTALEKLQLGGGYDAAKFAGEDEEAEAPKFSVPESQPKKQVVSRYAHKEGMGAQQYAGDLDRAGQLRAQEESEMAAISDMFGGDGAGRDAAALLSFAPKSKEEFEQFGAMVAEHFITDYYGKSGAHYKAMVKALLRKVAAPCTLADVRDLDKEISNIRTEKEREKKEEEAKNAAKGKKGKRGGHLKMERDVTAGMEGDDGDYIDEYDDFM